MVVSFFEGAGVLWFVKAIVGATYFKANPHYPTPRSGGTVLTPSTVKHGQNEQANKQSQQNDNSNLAAAMVLFYLRFCLKGKHIRKGCWLLYSVFQPRNTQNHVVFSKLFCKPYFAGCHTVCLCNRSLKVLTSATRVSNMRLTITVCP